MHMTQDKDFTATGQSDGLMGKRHTLRVSGTWAGTLQPQSYIDGAWVDEGSTISGGTATTVEIEFIHARPFRVDCTIFTSGTIATHLETDG